MPESEFSEDEFEDNLLHELQYVYGRGLPHFKPSRTLEHPLGYDFAVNTDYSISRARNVYVDDPRLRALYPSQVSAILPRRYVSSFIQCKVPYRVTRRQSPNEGVWDHWGGTYYKWGITSHQNEALINTERSLAGNAIVRYAAPCFSTYVESEAFCVRRAITQRTHFQSPTRLANHNLYTYTSPLRPGRAFSKPEDIDPILLLGELNHELWGIAAQKRDDTRFIIHLYTLFQSFIAVFEERRQLLIQRQDIETADLALGQLADLPLDPLQELTQGETEAVSAILNEGGFATLRTYATLIFCIQRIAREELNSQWRVFYS